MKQLIDSDSDQYLQTSLSSICWTEYTFQFIINKILKYCYSLLKFLFKQQDLSLTVRRMRARVFQCMHTNSLFRICSNMTIMVIHMNYRLVKKWKTVRTFTRAFHEKHTPDLLISRPPHTNNGICYRNTHFYPYPSPCPSPGPCCLSNAGS